MGEQRYLGLVELAKAAKPCPPTTRQRLEKFEAIQVEIQQQIQLDLDKLDRWAKSRDAVLERVANLKAQLEHARTEHKQAVLDLQSQYVAETPKTAPKISIREICEGRLDLESILTMDDFLGTQEAQELYDLETQEVEELTKRKDEVAQQIQKGLADYSKASLDKVKAALAAQKEQLQRLEGKKRKIGGGDPEPGPAAASTGGAGPAAAASAPAADAPACAAAPAAAEGPKPAAGDSPTFEERLAAAMQEREARSL